MRLSDQNWCDAKTGMCGDLSLNADGRRYRSRKDAQSPHGTWSSPRSAATIESV